MSQSTYEPIRAIPERPNLDFDRKQAKALVKAHGRGDPEALARIRAVHPRFGSLPDADLASAGFKLADAQWVVAREYGHTSWPRWKQWVAFLNADAEARADALLRAALGEDVERAHQLLARAPELAGHDLQTACAAADEARVDAILSRDEGAARRTGGPYAAEPLWTLCWSNLNLGPVAARRVQIAQKLLARGADPNARFEKDSRFGPFQATTLLGCVEHGHVGVAKTLLEAGANPDDNDSLYHATEPGRTPVLKLLLAHGANPARTNALPRALDFPDLTAARLLLEHGADPNEPLIQVESYPLHHLPLRGRGPDAADLLLEHGADIDRPNAEGLTPVQLARRLGQPALADHLLARGADPGEAPGDELLVACAAGETERARTLLAQDPDRLSRLAPNELGLLAEHVGLWNVTAVESFLAIGLHPDTRPEGASSALDGASFWGHVELVELLLAHGADPNLLNPYGGNALGALCFASRYFDAAEPAPRSEEQRQHDWVACAARLIDAGVRMTPEQLANASEPVAELLRVRGAPEPD